MNEREKYENYHKYQKREDMLFRRWYNEKIVRFIGGPLNGEVMQVDHLMPDKYVLEPEPMKPIDFTKEIDPTAKADIRLVRYSLIRDSFVIHPLGGSWLFAYVFAGWKK